MASVLNPGAPEGAGASSVPLGRPQLLAKSRAALLKSGSPYSLANLKNRSGTSSIGS